MTNIPVQTEVTKKRIEKARKVRSDTIQMNYALCRVVYRELIRINLAAGEKESRNGERSDR